MKNIEDVTIKKMPSNIEAEEALLGCVLLGGDIEMEIAEAWRKV